MDRPPVFADQAFAAALEATRSSDRWLIVDATAEWCSPCGCMDRTTWRDSAVVSWLETHATALQIDADREQEWARAHKIGAMPTLIAFKAGAEVDILLAGGRDEEAAAAERTAMSLDPSDEMKAWLARPRDQVTGR